MEKNKSFSKLRMCIIFCAFITLSFSQVGINTTSPADGSMLDINTTDKGVFIPRVDISDLNTIAPITGVGATSPELAAAESLLVYNTNATTGEGFYYWDGTEWILIGENRFWGLTGNSGTTVGTNFVGTTDANALRFRTNNIARFTMINGGASIRSHANGNAGAPTFSWQDDTGMGMYRIADDQLGFATVGTRRMSINAEGKVFVNFTGTSNAFLTAETTLATSNDRAIYGKADNGAAVGVMGRNRNTGIGVYGFNFGGSGYGVHGKVNANLGGYGIYGLSQSVTAYGVVGHTSNGGATASAVHAIGNLSATGTKTFIIDHPEDPENKYLKHFSIESNEVLNVYRGVEVFDGNGKAAVKLPKYYDLININPSYQLTAIGASMPNIFIEKELENGTFIVAGGVPGKRVSWEVKAERNDPYLQKYPHHKEVEVDKPFTEKGKYYVPELYGQPSEKGVSYRKN